jgi:LPPG:FO 2-phospho-L-lactate transferase
VFQEYFVRLKCDPAVDDIVFEGAEHANLSPAIASLPKATDIGAAIICPSNPYLSVDPILAIPQARAWLRSLSVPVIAVSPIIAGAAIKGPAAKIMSERGFPATAATVASHYRGLIDGIVIDVADQALAEPIEAMGIATHVTRTIMRSDEDRIQLAAECIEFARRLVAGSS